MKVAIVHDALVEFGGAERVLGLLTRIFPQADVYTAIARPNIVHTHLPTLSPRKLYTSWVQPFPIETHTSLLQLLAPLIWRSFTFDAYDVVISHSTLVMSSFINVTRGIHIAYVLSPPKNIVGIDPKTPLQRIIPYGPIIRSLYKQALHRTSRTLANSRHIQRVLKRTFDLDSSVLYPPVRLPITPSRRGKPEYFLCVSRLDRDKNIELAIHACTKLRLPLKIVGQTNEPRYETYLRRIAGPTIDFLGFVPDNKISPLYTNAIAFIFPAKNEDFGIAPLEAIARGVPVIGFYGGGTKETVIEGKTGTFFHHHTASSLEQAILRIRRMHFDVRFMRHRAAEFDYNHFRREITRHVEETLAEKKLL